MTNAANAPDVPAAEATAWKTYVSISLGLKSSKVSAGANAAWNESVVTSNETVRVGPCAASACRKSRTDRAPGLSKPGGVSPMQTLESYVYVEPPPPDPVASSMLQPGGSRKMSELWQIST